MRVVLDTNVLVSGIKTRTGPCARVLDQVGDGGLEVVYSTEVAIEYLRVLSYPRLKLPPLDVDSVLDLIERDGLLVTPEPLPPLKDSADTKFLEAAVAGEAAYLITGNLKDFPRSPHKGVKIVAPAEFLKLDFE